jgi:hypothetical protein
VVRSGVEPPCNHFSVCSSHGRNHRRRAPGCSFGRGRRPQGHCGRHQSESFPWVSAEIRDDRLSAPLPRNLTCRQFTVTQRRSAPRIRFWLLTGMLQPCVHGRIHPCASRRAPSPFPQLA